MKRKGSDKGTVKGTGKLEKKQKKEKGEAAKRKRKDRTAKAIEGFRKSVRKSRTTDRKEKR